MTQTVSILGINGRFGQESAKAFVAAGWRVIGMGRDNRAQLEGVQFMKGDANDPAQLRAAVADADVVVNGLNLPYDKWENGRAEAQLERVLGVLKGTGKTLMFPGNIYNYGAKQHVISPDTPQQPEKEKGRIRKRMEEQLQRASGEGLQVLIVRLADFFAPHAVQTNFDLMLLRRIRSGVIQYVGDLSRKHSWAYLPDVGRVFVALAEKRHAFARFRTFHYSGHFVSGHEMIGAIQAALPVRARVKPFPLGMLRVVGMFVPIVRAVMEMIYLWEEPHQLVDPELDTLLGAGFKTPFGEAVRKTVTSYLPEKGRMAVRSRLAA